MASTLVSAAPEDVRAVFAALEGMDPKWRVQIGQPDATDGWIRGTDFADAKAGPFHAMLLPQGNLCASCPWYPMTSACAGIWSSWSAS